MQPLHHQFSDTQHGADFVQHFGPSKTELEISGDADSGLSMQLFALDQPGAAGNGQIHLAVEAEIANGAKNLPEVLFRHFSPSTAAVRQTFG